MEVSESAHFRHSRRTGGEKKSSRVRAQVFCSARKLERVRVYVWKESKEEIRGGEETNIGAKLISATRPQSLTIVFSLWLLATLLRPPSLFFSSGSGLHDNRGTLLAPTVPYRFLRLAQLPIILVDHPVHTSETIPSRRPHLRQIFRHPEYFSAIASSVRSLLRGSFRAASRLIGRPRPPSDSYPP